MKYIKPEDYKKLTKVNTEESRNFMANYMDMPDEEANEALAKILGELSKKDNDDMIEFLIKDEGEAIDGYDKAIKAWKAQSKDTKVLEAIKADEYRHVSDLQGLKKAEEGKK